MLIKSLFSFLEKITNKEKYLDKKFLNKINKKIDFYNSNIKNKLLKIDNTLKDKREISFLHSGHLGDLIYSLAVIKKIAQTHKCKLYIQINKKNKVEYKNHPAGNVLINKKMGDFFLPLIKKQNYLDVAEIYNNEPIDIDLDFFREIPVNIFSHSMRWYSHLTGVPISMDEPFLEVEKKLNFHNKITIVRTTRYRNYYINYKFLQNAKNIICVGLKSEYEELKKDIPNLIFHDCKNFLEMAEIINSSKFFIGNMTFAYAVAEALKIPRLLEVSPDYPVVFPVGKNGYDFYHQIHFEKYFNLLNN
jgi:ADP-heptose:LPS heptosyltransferase